MTDGEWAAYLQRKLDSGQLEYAPGSDRLTPLARDADVGSTHFDGCEAVHEDCAAAKADKPKLSEAEIQGQIIAALIYDGWQVWRINSGAAKFDGKDGKKRYVEFCRWGALGFPFTAEGNPDVIALKNSYALEIETKTEDGRLRPGQVRCLEAAENCGNTYIVARGVEDIEPWLERLEAT